MTRDQLAIISVLLFSVGMSLLVAPLVTENGSVTNAGLFYGFIVGLLLSSGLYLRIRPETSHQQIVARRE